MTFIIEDGTIVTNANSYVTLAEIKAYAVAKYYIRHRSCYRIAIGFSC